MTTAELFKSELWRAFEEAAKDEQQSPLNVLNGLMRDYVESRSDSALFDDIERESNPHGYTEDDAVELVRQARLEKMRG